MHTRTLGKLAYAAVVLGIVAYGVAQYQGFHGTAGLRARQREIEVLSETNSRLRSEVGQMQQHIERLQNDPVEQDLEIRKRLKFLKPGEKWYILQDGDAKPSPDPQFR